jgi:hypothetical protein
MKGWLLACLVSLAACAAPTPRPVLLCNGTIYLGAVGSAGHWPKVEALLVHDGRVRAAGSRAELESLAPDHDILDLNGMTAIPGLQDAHGHFEALGAALESVDLRGCASFSELVERVAARASRAAPGTWIEGRGWDQNLWNPPEFPHHGALSAATPNHPVVLQRVDGHALLANEAAMRSAGVEGKRSGESAGAGGRVLLDAQERPTGVFIDDACALVQRAIPSPSRAQRRERFLRAQEELLSLGLTAIHDMGIDREGFEILRQLEADGELRIRAVEYFSGDASLSAEKLAGFPTARDGDERLCLVGVKLYADGALGSRGAALLEPYHDDPTQRGLTLLSDEELARAIAVCAERGLQPAVHAIGDRANRAVLDAYSARMGADPKFRALRPRIEHAQVVAPADWPRFEELGVIPSMQPTHATSDMPWAPSRLGEQRIEGAYAWRRLCPDAMRLAFGSDFPVESPDPRAGIYSAVTCAGPDGLPAEGFRPDQRLTLPEALSTFTVGASYAARQEDRRGRLLPGFAADITVLRSDPFVVPLALWKSEPVMATLIQGELEHRADGAKLERYAPHGSH